MDPAHYHPPQINAFQMEQFAPKHHPHLQQMLSVRNGIVHASQLDLVVLVILPISVLKLYQMHYVPPIKQLNLVI